MLVLTLIAGLIILVIGGDLFVRGAVSIAERLGVSAWLIGLTLVGFGTSTPELVTSLQAAFAGSPGVAVGNVVGSNIANILLILGLAALVSPVIVMKGALKRDGMVLILSALACLSAVMMGSLGRPVGLVFLFGLAAYLGLAIWQEGRTGQVSAAGIIDAGHRQRSLRGMLVPGLLTLAGLAMTIFGASLLIDGAIGLASQLGVSETIIGLSIVAVGTSLPELVTSLMAAIRKQSDVAFGNIVGSNIYNVLGILGVTALVHPIGVPSQIVAVDIWVMLAATAALILFAATRHRIGRIEGALLAAGYAAYIAWLAAGA